MQFRGIMLTLAFGCTPAAMPVAPDHPTNPDAPTGRLAGPPAALRPGVASAEPASEPSTGTTPAPAPASKKPADPPAPAPQQGHEGHH